MAPKETPVTMYARAHTEEMLLVLVDIARNGQKEAARASAAIAVLNRAWGTPAQSVEISAPKEKEFDLSTLSPDELRDYHRLQLKIQQAQGAEYVEDGETVPGDLKQADIVPYEKPPGPQVSEPVPQAMEFPDEDVSSDPADPADPAGGVGNPSPSDPPGSSPLILIPLNK